MAENKGPRQKIRRGSYLAIHEAQRLGLNPIEMLAEVYQLAIQGYKDNRGITDKMDGGAQWLAVARQAADSLANYVHPKLSAVAVHEIMAMDEQNKRASMTTEEAIKVISEDPFLKNQVKNRDVIEQINVVREKPLLPVGEANE